MAETVCDEYTLEDEEDARAKDAALEGIAGLEEDGVDGQGTEDAAEDGALTPNQDDTGTGAATQAF